jgi:hypothetical protein
MKHPIANLFPEFARDLLDVKGRDLIALIGDDAIKSVIVSLLCGENIRVVTEPLTCRRLSVSNAAMLVLLLKGCTDPKFITTLPSRAVEEYGNTNKRLEKQILQWLLGLTGKSVQNVLRSDRGNLERYLHSLEQSFAESLSLVKQQVGDIRGQLSLDTASVKVDWQFLFRLFTAVGAQTLAIRGSEKSMYGKLFERLILGSLLTILGFRLIDPKIDTTSVDKVFWLTERGHKRESDATLLLEAGKGIRFDIGFIGPGNPEISLDKVSRFEREMERGRQRHFMRTFIIVDRIGQRSRIVELAKQIDGTIVQMSMAYWPKIIVERMHERTGFTHRLLEISETEMQGYFDEQIREIDLSKFL